MLPMQSVPEVTIKERAQRRHSMEVVALTRLRRRRSRASRQPHRRGHSILSMWRRAASILPASRLRDAKRRVAQERGRAALCRRSDYARVVHRLRRRRRADRELHPGIGRAHPASLLRRARRSVMVHGRPQRCVRERDRGIRTRPAMPGRWCRSSATSAPWRWRVSRPPGRARQGGDVARSADAEGSRRRTAHAGAVSPAQAAPRAKTQRNCIGRRSRPKSSRA